MTLWLLPVVLVLSLLLTGALRKYALSRSLLDVPNARSSHQLPTPRGGGVAIVLSFLVMIPLLGVAGATSWSGLIALLGAGFSVAVIGFLDDHGHIAARWRLLGHFSAAAWALYWLGGLPVVSVFGIVVDLGWVGNILAAFYLVWMLNLYNFMDGIDGLASIEAICVGLSISLIYYLTGFSDLVWLPLLLTMAVAGFLYWNFPFARIFMGDAGSGFLGMTLGVLSIQAAWHAPQLLWAWLALLGVFIVDATFTLVRRLVRGDKVYEAHRSHGYQYASRQFGKHVPVTLAIGIINLLWLTPIAILIAMAKIDGLFGLIIAYAPLIALAVRFHAGELESSR
ncbi:MraY family glycosyltransferase [Pseudomonas sp. YuFO8]|jgi:Fuc2NAc and GlcNAc transferase|uniref:MraY family glycosyltransferase n=1 Tax=Pseudomonas sp. YuFO8 TaxID=3095361 RepID=UPI002B24F02C|nr:glycosyltransferase family 4 protein [Pseudomonas sp. YuFO8]MEB2625104.1 glycosyltransferase family 4 protein [Pseudomonas sp. YuFO8]